VGRAGDARVVVADRLLALAGELGVIEVDPGLYEGAQVGLDGRLVLRRGRHDAGGLDDAVRVDLVAVVQGAPGRLGDAVADAGARRHLDGGPVRRFVIADEPQRLIDRVDRLHGPHDDATERVVAGRAQPGVPGCLARQRGQPSRAERVPGQRSGEVPAATGQVRVQRGGVPDVLLDHVLVPPRRGERQARARRHGAPLDRVGSGPAQREHVRLARVIGEVEPGDPCCRGQRVIERPAQRVGERGELGPGGRPVEAADADVDGVNGPAADQFHDGVPGLLERQAALHDVAPGRGHLDSAAVTEEIRRVQEVDVQRMALDPFPAVQQPAQVGDRSLDGDAAGVLDRLARAHLVGDRADAADPGRDVRRLSVGATAQECLEEAGRLVDVQPRLFDPVAAGPDVQGAFAFHPGQFGDRQDAVVLVCHVQRLFPVALSRGGAGLNLAVRRPRACRSVRHRVPGPRSRPGRPRPRGSGARPPARSRSRSGRRRGRSRS